MNNPQKEMTAAEAAMALANDICDLRNNQLAEKNVRYIPKNFYASNIADCDRQMVYALLDWDKRALFTSEALAVMDAGVKEERNINIMLGQLGFETSKQQNPIQIKNRAGETICTGKIDGMIKYNGHFVPYEIKSMNDNTFRQISSLEDFQKQPWLRKYIRQLQLYLFGNGCEAGIFIISNFRQLKIIPVYLDLGECEWILQKLERNWEMQKKREYPAPMEYSEKQCGYCPFKHVCLVEHKNEGAAMIDSPELIEKLERREALKPTADEYADLDSELKEPFKRQRLPEVFIGDKWLVKTKVSKSIGIDTKAIPAEIAKQYQKDTERVAVSFERI